MKNNLKIFIVSLSAFLFMPIYASSATLDIDAGGYLIGVNSVDISGSLYDVSFTDGSCVELFSGCDQTEDFFWQSLLSIEAANDALAAQAFAGAETPSVSWQAQWDPGLIGALASVASGPSFVLDYVDWGASTTFGQCDGPNDYLAFGTCFHNDVPDGGVRTR